MIDDCKDCGFYDHPVWTVVPYAELTRWQRLRSWASGGGVYMRDQFKHVCFEPDIRSADYGD